MSNSQYFISPPQLVDSDQLILFYENNIVADGDNYLWRKSDVEKLLSPALVCLIVEKSERRVIALDLESDISEDLFATCRSLRSFLFGEGALDFALAGKANQILNWYKGHQYCGKCGAKAQRHIDHRALYCPECEEQFFPRINPCVIVLVTRGEEILLARSSRFRHGFFSCLAGFIEVGETPEETVLREVREEVGLSVKNIKYVKSQSWPFPSQLMLGFHADYAGGEIVPEPAEIEEAHWFDVRDLPSVPSPNVSVAGELIKTYIDLMNREDV